MWLHPGGTTVNQTPSPATGRALINTLRQQACACAGAPATAAREALFRMLIAEYGRPLFHFVLRRIGHPDDAQDIAQQAFVEAALTLSRYRGEAELSTWIFGIATNLTRNYLSRAPQRRHAFESDDILASLPAPQPDAADRLDQRRALSVMNDALQALPRGSAEALTLVAVDGLSYQEAAQELGVPIGTVRSRVSRARADVRSRLLHHGMGPGT